VLVTGCEGLIGQIVTPALSDAGHIVHGFDKQASPEMDVTDRAAVDAAMQDVDAVVHLAAIPHPFRVKDEVYEEINVRGTQIVIDSAEAADVTHFVYMSSSDVYGFCGGPARDEPWPLPPFLEGSVNLEHMDTCAYARSKYDGEKALIASLIPHRVAFRLESPSPPSPPDPAHHNIVCSHETIARAVVAALTFDEDFTLVANLSDPNPAYDTYRLQELLSRCES
jgi:nucleoside-diphosphate-sugar epimerase